MRLFKRNSFGHILFLKRWVIRLVGILSYRRFRGINNLKISGSEIIQNLPENNVLFVSNHQTYFADATAMYHVINASLKGRENSIKNIGYIWWPKLNLYFVAAKETMKEGLLPKILAYAGSVSIERSWRSQGKDIKRNVQSKDIDSVEKALKEGWVITFPQGTTTPWKPIRKGTAHLIKKNKPIVVPVVIDGFRRSFDKKGLFLKKKGVDQLMRFKKPMKIDYENDSIDQIVKNIGVAIEQDHSFLIN
jgi:1-acyl-sn-glycerol-3-phosphate acyltransferase|tara:strand:- start:1427 stop:2170 length:744 start_codon:yes stop_codon:yes gene_type:complete